ncbi:hypothetical protein [Bacillus thuringiensis]|uniref:hypothetical protein n=1 Tax=Bacillus thuringiensis TaxID=1428 RepID=UPI0021D65794|nr:hypothetical protein [Bacillus thuringiensis]MCU7668019.1 hypothetical protein [Bacillus thuringiensis]
MNFEDKKIKDFDRMTAEEKYEYATKWDEYQQVVALSVLQSAVNRFGIAPEEVDFHKSLVELTNDDEELAAHVVLDVHEELSVKVDESELHPFEVYDNLLDLILVISAEMTDEVLGYISMFDEMEMAFSG